jgi:hypothetical protein
MEDKIYKQFGYCLNEILTSCSKDSVNHDIIYNRCHETSVQLTKIVERKGKLKSKYNKYEFLEAYFFSFINFIEIKDENDAILLRQFESSLNKFSIILSLLDSEQYESHLFFIDHYMKD